MWYKESGAPSFENLGEDSPTGQFGGVSNGDLRSFVFVAGQGDDTVATGAGDDRIVDSWLAPDRDPTDPSLPEVTGTGEDRFYGGAGNDTLAGEAGHDLLMGGDHNDMLMGGEGGDVLDGGAGDDTLLGGLGDDSMVGGEGGDRYGVDSLGDLIDETGTTGRDMVSSNSIALDLTLYTNIEDGLLRGSLDLDLTGSDFGNFLMGNRGGNWIEAAGGDDYLAGYNGDDTLFGGAGNDSMHGGSGDDDLSGGTGDDTINGSTGTDTLTGGEGADEFLFFTSDTLRRGRQADVITDFTMGEDRLVLAGQSDSFAMVDAFSAGGETEFFMDTERLRLRCDYDGDGLVDFSFILQGAVGITAADITVYVT